MDYSSWKIFENKVVKTELLNATHDLYIYILLTAIFQEMLTLNAQQQLVEDLLILSGYFPFFISSLYLLLSLSKFSCRKKHHVYNLYPILNTLSFRYVMYYLVS